jgi:phenylpropionate dioxygenase-like ring-hydroxylating dioxygenase large terminal subunit
MHVNEDRLRVAWPQHFNQIPKEVFHRDDIYRQEMQKIFYGREWHPVAHVAEIANNGDFKTMYLGEAPVMTLRGDDGEVRVFSNSCPHRGTQLATCGRGNAERIECPYHRWSFSTQGRLLGAPGMRDFPPGFNRDDYGLRKIRSAIVHGIVFATLSDETPAIDDYLGDVAPYLAKSLGDGAPLVLLGYQKVSYATNWKEYGDNEGYHAPLLHSAFRLLQWQGSPGLQFMTRYAHKVISAQLNHSSNNGFLADNSVIETRDTSSQPQSTIVSLFPVTVITRHLDVMSLRYAIPRAPDRTEVHYAYFGLASDSEALKLHRLRQASNLLGPSGLISLEDGAVFNRLHVGSRSQGTVEFQKGVRDRDSAPDVLQQNDEAGNLLRWERYRQTMEFERG